MKFWNLKGGILSLFPLPNGVEKLKEVKISTIQYESEQIIKKKMYCQNFHK